MGAEWVVAVEVVVMAMKWCLEREQEAGAAAATPHREGAYGP
jgi:hypothetical protein